MRALRTAAVVLAATFAFAGTAHADVISFDPPSIDLGDQPIGANPAVKVTATNTSGHTVKVNSGSVSGYSWGSLNPDYGPGGGDCFFATLAPGESCDFHFFVPVQRYHEVSLKYCLTAVPGDNETDCMDITGNNNPFCD